MPSENTIQKYMRLLFNLLPRGLVFENIGPIFRNLIEGHAVELGRVEDQVNALISEANPATATVDGLLPAWEKDYLLPFELPNSGDSQATRQARVVAKRQLHYSGPNIDFWAAQAAMFGAQIEIYEGVDVFMDCSMTCDKSLVLLESIFVWAVFHEGEDGYQDKLKASFLRLKPSHTAVTFNPTIGSDYLDPFNHDEVPSSLYNDPEALEDYENDPTAYRIIYGEVGGQP